MSLSVVLAPVARFLTKPRSICGLTDSVLNIKGIVHVFSATVSIVYLQMTKLKEHG